MPSILKLPKVLEILEENGIIDKGFTERYRKTKILLMRDSCGDDCQESCVAEEIAMRLQELGYYAEVFPNSLLIFTNTGEKWIEYSEYWLMKKLGEAKEEAPDILERINVEEIVLSAIVDSARILAAEKNAGVAIIQSGDWDRVYIVVTNAPADIAEKVSDEYDEECDKLEDDES